MIAPKPERLPYAHRVSSLIEPYGHRMGNLSFDDWRDLARGLSKLDPTKKINFPEMTRIFINALAPSFLDDGGYIDKVAAIIRIDRAQSDSGIQLHTAVASEVTFVKTSVPFHLDVVQRQLLDIAATRDIDELREKLSIECKWFYDPNRIRSQILTLEELQRKLKERVSPTKPSGERE